MDIKKHGTRLRALVIAVVLVAGVPGDAQASQRCYEDMSCWTWSTMGNHQRGVTLDTGRTVVVSPLRFCRLDRSGRIDWSRTPRLKGDATARRTCK